MLKRSGLKKSGLAYLLAGAVTCIAQSAQGQVVEEIVVTAQKRGEERLQDVPVPVSAIRAATLVENNQLRLQDYYTRIPGFSVSPSPSSGNQQVLAIRGVTTGVGTNPTVGITVDDVPYGASTNSGGGNTIPDLDPSDLARVEVLRGPQGTLYGAASMGGLLQFVTVDPSTERMSGRMQVGLSSVENGASMGYTVRGSANLPVNDELAIRASAFTREDPGYIDNPVLGIDGVNEQRVNGGRLSGLWRPSESFSMKVNALVQDSEGDGSNNVDVVPELGDLQQNYIRDVGAFDRTVQAYSMTLTGKIRNFDLTSVSGYNVNSYRDSLDYTYALGSSAQALFGVSGAPIFNDASHRKFSQEFRLSTPIGSRLEWLLGAFYTHGKTEARQQLLAEDPDTGETQGALIDSTAPSTFTEYAAFTNLAINVTDRFDIQVGARQSSIKGVTKSGSLTGAMYGNLVISSAETQSEHDAFTYLFTPRFKFSEDLMVYARMASGYRPGGGVTDPTPTTRCVVLNLPCSYSPDKTKNYEVGAKGNLLNGALSFDASVYHIDWDGIQILLIDPDTTFAYNINGGKAKSEGVELTLEARPLDGLTVAAWASYSDAVLTEDFPATSAAYGESGERLPNSSRVSGSLSVDYSFPLAADLTGFVGGIASYMGDSLGLFMQTAERQRFDSYTKVDLRAGANIGAWAVNLFVNNVSDERAAIGGGLGTFPPSGFTFIQPRTVGLSVAKDF